MGLRGERAAGLPAAGDARPHKLSPTCSRPDRRQTPRPKAQGASAGASAAAAVRSSAAARYLLHDPHLDCAETALHLGRLPLELDVRAGATVAQQVAVGEAVRLDEQSLPLLRA